MKKIRRELAYFSIISFFYIGSSIPEKLIIPIGKFFGWLAYILMPATRKKVLRRLKKALSHRFNPGERRLICKKNFQHWGICLFEVTRLRYIRNLADLDKKVTIRQREVLDRALARGQGAILLTPHLGNWEITAAYISLLGYDFAVLAKDVYDSRLNELLLKIRGGRKIVNIPRDSIFTAVKYLKQGYILGILPDQATRVSGDYIDFFGYPAFTPTGPAKISMKTGVPLLLFYNYRDDGGKINIVFDEVMEISGLNEMEITKIWSKRFEEYITAKPEQWVWLHDRWKKI